MILNGYPPLGDEEAEVCLLKIGVSWVGGAAQDELTVAGVNKARFPYMHPASRPAHVRRKGKASNQPQALISSNRYTANFT